MSADTTRSTGVIAILVVGTVLLLLTLVHRVGGQAKVAKSFVEQQIESGSKKYWRIPDSPETLTLRLSPKQCKRFWEVEPSGREIDWMAPYESRVLWYEVTARNTKTGATRTLWPGKVFHAGDKMPNYDLFREELSIRVARVSGPDTFLKLDLLYIPDSFGIKGGPFGNKTVE